MIKTKKENKKANDATTLMNEIVHIENDISFQDYLATYKRIENAMSKCELDEVDDNLFLLKIHEKVLVDIFQFRLEEKRKAIQEARERNKHRVVKRISQ